GRELAVGGGEVVVPEQRHLFLQRAPRMNHAKQPALARVLDVDVRRKKIFGGYLRVVGPSDAAIDVVRPSFVGDEIRDRIGRRHVAEDFDVGGARAESGAAKQVIDFRVELRHSILRVRSGAVRERSSRLRPRRWLGTGAMTLWQGPPVPDRCGYNATRGTDTRKWFHLRR